MTRAAAAPRRGVRAALAVGMAGLVQHPWLAALLLATTMVQGVLQGLLVWAMRESLRGFERTGGATAGALAASAALVLGVWVLRSATTFAGEVLAAHLAHRVERAGVRRLLGKLLALSVRFFDKHSEGDLAVASYLDLKGVRLVTMEIGVLVLHLTRLVGLAAVAWMISPKLTMVGLLLLPIGLLPAHWLGTRLVRAAHKERETIGGLSNNFIQLSQGIRLIKVNQGEARILERAEHHMRELYRVLLRQVEGKGAARFLFETVAGTALVLVLVLGARDVVAGMLEWESLLSLLIAVLAVYAPATGLLTSYNQLNVLLPNLDRVERVLRAPVEVRDRPGALPLRGAPELIALENVSFAYGATPVLHGISATFRRGESIGIVGPSGAGKSTLVALLLRFYDPTEGRITFDGVDLRDLRYQDLLAHCALVLQEPFLFLDTVANNIRIGKPDASMAEVIAAAQAANIHDDIVRMERGYDTVLGRSRDGRGLSGGQKQRICIAAALLKNAPILFLDEATSNLDSVSERAVQEAIERLMAGRTTFVIAHRLSTLRAMDRILVLQDGRVAGLGPHAELMAECPVYQRLWRSQSGEPTRAAGSAVRIRGTA